MAANTMGYLMNLVGREVKINRGGPDSVKGTLLSIQSDFVVVRAKDGIVYINSAHIKSISEGGSSGGSKSGGSKSGGSKSGGSRSGGHQRIVMAHSFAGVIQMLQHQFVRINRGGPEKIEGFIVEVNHDSVLVVVKREAVRIPIFHVKTISPLNRSGGNRSQGNRSGQNNAGQQSGSQNWGQHSQGNRSQGGQSQGNRSHKSKSGRQSQGNKSRSGHSSGQNRNSQLMAQYALGLMGKRAAARRK